MTVLAFSRKGRDQKADCRASMKFGRRVSYETDILEEVPFHHSAVYSSAVR